jgi:hypothetical protein
MNERNKIVVLDDFMESDFFEQAKSKIDSHEQQYHFQKNISMSGEGDPRFYYGFGCTFVAAKKPDIYHKLPNKDYIFSINEKIKREFGFKVVGRSRLDMTTYRGEEQVKFGAHIDLNGYHHTTIFYFTTCNGPTVIYNERLMRGDVPENLNLTEKERVYPKENRLVLFPGNHIHTGMSATDSPNRILLNSNFI